ncbi:hypothetical protein E3P99_02637 [Wallemia hederae]|uniref:NADP-dependent oxidoreductase domain-containing protein n=1 Tax=Wallemia hederae TaxID=1540922 RepID=A0A4T0FJG5_9BASI|nr:hypothetical protein E3P99_02637 [Wallemia hederae]
MSSHISNLASAYHLPAGNTIPALQLGVYKSDPAVTTKSVQTALENGYKGVDSAQYYANEKESAEAINAYEKAHQENIFITTKIMESAGDVDANYHKCLESIEKIGKAVDLFLIHSPGQARGAEDRKSLWLALERLVEEKRVKAIGVSNYGVKHLQELEKYATQPISVNQLELHPWFQQREIVSYCQQRGILLEAYCPLVRGKKAEHPTLVRIASECAKSWAQVLVRWSLQKAFVTLPKSDNADRQIHNADVFDFVLSDEQMHALDALDAGEHIAPNPVNCD